MTALDELNKINITNDLEGFKVMKEHLLSMPEKSMDDSESCSYRGSIFSGDYEEYKYNGNACAVGALIKDYVYNQFDLEGVSIEWPIDENIILDCVQMSHQFWDITKNSFIMMRVFQRIHDGYDIEKWPLIISNMEKHFIFSDNGDLVGFSDRFSDLIFDHYYNHEYGEKGIVPALDKTVIELVADILHGR